MNKRSPISSSLVVPLRGPNPFPALERPNPIQIGNVIYTFSWPPLDTVYFQRLSLKLKDVRGAPDIRSPMGHRLSTKNRLRENTPLGFSIFERVPALVCLAWDLHPIGPLGGIEKLMNPEMRFVPMSVRLLVGSGERCAQEFAAY